MPAIATVPGSGNEDIDGLLVGYRWGVSHVTYSFPASASFYGASYSPDNEPLNNFAALNTVQQAAARAALAMYARVANLTFSEITETAQVHADLRLAESNDPQTAWGYYPSTSDSGGDSWYNNSSHRYDNAVKGSYAYLTFIHELGHNLGLKHGHEGPGAMSAAHDSMEYSVMTYRSYKWQALQGGYTNESGGYTQTLMMYDIAALQHLYGANYTANSGNTVYSWDPFNGEFFIDGAGQGAPVRDKVFMTVWDGGGIDTYDFSSYETGVSADLRPGTWTLMSQVQRAYLGAGHYAEGNVANALLHEGDVRSLIENVSGGSGDDRLAGNQAANILSGNAGNDVLIATDGLDVLDGGPGVDTADYSIFASAVWVSLIYPGYEAWTMDRPTLTGGTWRIIGDLSHIENLIGTPADDYLGGDAGSNVLDAGAGDDTLVWSGGGADTLNGGFGADTANFQAFGSAVWVSLVYAGPEAWTMDLGTLSGGSWRIISDLSSIENLVGTTFNDFLNGDAAANRIDGGNGSDIISGGGGNDTLVWSGGYDMIDGGAGFDTADFSGFGPAVWVDLAYWSYEAWTMDRATLTGGTWRPIADLSAIESVLGTGSDDFLAGDAAGNFLRGGPGADTLSGAAGSDTFDYDSTADGLDTITDFAIGAGGDALDVRGVLTGYTPGTSSLRDFVQVSGGSSTTISLNADGAGADFVALVTLQGVAMTSNLLEQMISAGNLVLA